MPEQLTGKALLKKVKELGHLNKTEKAKACGYVNTTRKGVERAKMMDFLSALVSAEKIPLEPEKPTSRRRGKEASYRTTVHSNGNLLIGSAYTQQLGLKPGDEFDIKLGHKNIRIERVSSEDMSESFVAA